MPPAVDHLFEPTANVLAPLLLRQLVLPLARFNLDFLPEPPGPLIALVALALQVLVLRQPAAAKPLVTESLTGFLVVGGQGNHRRQVRFSLFDQASLLAP